MRLSRILFWAWIVCALGLSAVAQDQGQAAAAPADSAAQTQGGEQAPSAPGAAAPASQEREWIPEGIAALGQNAVSRTEFRLDHSMLVLASKLDKDNADLRRVIAGVNGVSVRSFRFAGEVPLYPAIMESIREQYRGAGWLHLVSDHKSGNGMHTDLWIHLDEAAIRDIAVLLVRAKQVSFVAASGSVTPLDLLHLSGHFGIPKMDRGVVVPVPRPGR
jgi:hypothetical protein